MVEEVFTSNFDLGLKRLGDIASQRPRFKVNGGIYPKEAYLCVSLEYARRFLPVRLHLSCDFDPKASLPTAQDLLGACVDVAANYYGQILSQPKLKHLAKMALPSTTNHDALIKALEVPSDWTPIQMDQYLIHVRFESNEKQ